jgi:hypothetical protein
MNASTFLPLCKQTIIWRPLVGRDSYGKPIYGIAQAFPGRRTYKASRVASYERGTKGQGPEVISESQIWMLSLTLPAPNINYEDAVYVDGDLMMGSDPSNLPPILSVAQPADETGAAFFTKIFLGSSNG